MFDKGELQNGGKRARVEIPTPYGTVVVEQVAGQPPQIQHPPEVELVIVEEE